MKTVALVLGQTKYLSKHVAQCVLGPSEAVIKLYFLIMEHASCLPWRSY